MPKIISIEGNIGSGKTTILGIISNLLKTKVGIEFLKEPVDEWINLKDSKGQNILEVFYKNPERWSYSFQMNAYISKMKLLEKASRDAGLELLVCERSVETDRNCFAKQLYEDGKINELEWKLYNNWYYWLKEKTENTVDGIIYLRCSPEISYQRINKRSRKEENSIPIEYLTKIHQKHDEWLTNNNKNVLIIDVSADFEENINQKKKVINQILIFLDKILES